MNQSSLRTDIQHDVETHLYVSALFSKFIVNMFNAETQRCASTSCTLPAIRRVGGSLLYYAQGLGLPGCIHGA